jgi:hypothetical protein
LFLYEHANDCTQLIHYASPLQGHGDGVLSACAPYLATGSNDHTSKLRLLNADCSAATCIVRQAAAAEAAADRGGKWLQAREQIGTEGFGRLLN